MRAFRVLGVAGLAGSLLMVPAAFAQNDGFQNGYQNDGQQPQGYAPQDGQQPQQYYSNGDGQDQYGGQYSNYDAQPQDQVPVEMADTAPPPFPEDAYDQPPIPGDGYAWTPGYWSWQGEWVWVSGAWAAPPYEGALWTPGYWGGYESGWGWYPGSWGLTVGYYGGVYYGGGYFGNGFCGGRWDDHDHHYWNNRNVVNIREGGHFHTFGGEREPRGERGFRAVSDARRSGGGFGNRGFANESVTRGNNLRASGGNNFRTGGGNNFRAGGGNDLRTSRASQADNFRSAPAGNNVRTSGGIDMRSHRADSFGSGGMRAYDQPRNNGFNQRGFNQGRVNQGVFNPGTGRDAGRGFSQPAGQGFSNQRSSGSGFGSSRGYSPAPRASGGSSGFRGGGANFSGGNPQRSGGFGGGGGGFSGGGGGIHGDGAFRGGGRH